MKKGFTLIELLVVVAIIGILTSVALASLNTARTKGADSAIKAAMSQFRAQAEMGDSGWPLTYGTALSIAACPGTTGNANIFTTASGVKIINNAVANAGKALSNTECATDGSAYAIAVPLKSSGDWCVDSAGNAKAITAGALTGTECP